MDFLIDCGATSSLISSSKLSEIDPNNSLPVTPIARTLHTVNGEPMTVDGSVDLVIQIGQEYFDLTFIVCNIDLDGILGQDFLRKHVDSINYKQSCLVIGSNKVPLWTGGQGLQVCRVEMRNTIKLPPQSRMWVPIKIPHSEHLAPAGFIEPSFDLMGKKEITLMAGIVQTSAEAVVNVLNYGKEAVTLYKNTCLGTCESYFEPPAMESDLIAHVHEPTTDSTIPSHLSDLLERSSNHLSESEKQDLVRTLNKYQDVFSRSSEDIGRTDLVQHSINTRDTPPIRQPPRRLPLGKRQTEKEEINKMLQRGVIEPSNSAWASPVVLVTKKDGTPRFCIDYRRVNDCTVKDAYPLPRVDDCIDSLSGAKFFSSLDLNSGYWQVGMKPEDKEKTAFATTMGLYQFTVMSFGLANAPSTFERLMENVLRGLQWEECLLYMDDIIVPSRTIEQGLERLEHIFQRLKMANLKLKPSKCSLFQTQVNFLGHIVSESGIATNPDKISAVKNWAVPKNSKEVKSFLGLCSYYRRFVKDFAKIARPLHKVSEKHAKFQWSSECQESFEKLKEALISSAVLGYPVPGIQFILDTDASDEATGAVLSQQQNGREVVIAYFSKSLNQHEKSYCVTRKELLAVINALKAFHSYLYGQPVLLRTDNAAVSWMKNLKRPTGQVARWLEELGTYDLTIVHRPGLKHRNADALSRAPCNKCAKQNSGNMDDPTEQPESQGTLVSTDSISSELSDMSSDASSSNSLPTRVVTESASSDTTPFQDAMAILPNWSPDEIRVLQQQDPSLQLLMQCLTHSQNRPAWQQISSSTSSAKALWRMWDRLSLEDGILFRKWYSNDKDSIKQLVVPHQCHPDILYHFHNIPTSAHLGADKMLEKVRQSFYWPGMKEDIEKYCKQCHECGSRKPPKPSKAPLGSLTFSQPHERCAVDILGPLPKSEAGNRFILVISDCFTRWTEAIPLPNQESETVARAFVNEYVSRFGVPLQIHSDRGTNFTSKLFEDMCQFLQIHHTMSSAHRPQSNGIVERFNRTLATMLTMYCSTKQNTWDQFLPQVMMAYRSSIHASTGQTPNKMVFGREVVLPLQAYTGLPPQSNFNCTESEDYQSYVQELKVQLEDVHNQARIHLKKKTQYQKRHYDLQAKRRTFSVGDAVWVHDPSRRLGVCSKLAPQWKGPFIVTKKIDDLIFLVKNSSTATAKAIHIDRLTAYHGTKIPPWLVSVRNRLMDQQPSTSGASD